MQAIERLQALGIAPADILLPEKHVDMTRWAVIACDQYSSDAGYWAKADALVADSPSTLRLMLPEVYRDSPDAEAMQQNAVAAMEKYLSSGVFRTAPQSFVYVERTTPCAGPRLGLVAAFDLEKYEFKPGNKMPMRATEETILSRMPPRMAVRRAAALECPHVMVLVDDPAHTVIGPLAGKKGGFEKLYDAELMLGAGRIAGWRVTGEAEFSAIADALETLAQGGMLFAVGDGNHSLAAAKACWDELKSGLTPERRETHPARWALAELVNLHDAAFAFHPIHRVVFNADPVEMVATLLWEMNKRGWQATMGDAPAEAGQSIEYVCAEDKGYINVARPPVPVDAGTLQQALDIVLPSMPGASVDYVHGDDAAACIGMKPGNMTFLLKGMGKAGLFPAVETLGILPRKAFSMGEADEKRFYLECRKIQ